MKFYLVLMVLIGTVCSSPVCPDNCNYVDKHQYYIHHSRFHHVSELGETSVAPWNLTLNVTEGRDPEVIEHAMCRPCTLEHMIAKPIVIQISVYHRVRHTNDWCKCPYELAVGCTCVNEHQQ